MWNKLLNSLHPLSHLERQRVKYITNKKLPDFLKAALEQPIPTPDTALYDLQFLVMDFETSDLNPTTGRILSIGHLELHHLMLDIGTASHQYVNAERYVSPESAVVNHIVPEMLLGGVQFDEAMEALFASMAERLLIAHGTVIEKRFIDTYLHRRFDLPPPPLLWLDTLLIEKSLLRNKSGDVSDFQLSSIRKRYGLPPYLAHNALADSIATGELFLVLLKQIYAKQQPKLGGIYKPII